MQIGLLLWRFECCLCCLFFNRTSEADELTYTNSSPVPGCTVCHIPYSDADLPFPVVLTKCQVCRHVAFLYLFLLVCSYVGNGHFHRRFREQGWRSGNLRSGDFFLGGGGGRWWEYPPPTSVVTFVFCTLPCSERLCSRYLEKCFKGAKQDGENVLKEFFFTRIFLALVNRFSKEVVRGRKFLLITLKV